MRVLVLLLALYGALLSPTARAAGDERFRPMRIALVHDSTPGCAPACATWIAATGMIVAGTAARFARILRQVGPRRLPVLIDSVGGFVSDAMAMGRRIRALHLEVAVTRTVFDGCPDPGCQARPDGSVAGRPVGPASLCASACVLVLAAGEPRDATALTRVGVHQLIRHDTITQVRRLFRVLYREENGVRVVLSRTLIAERPLSTRLTTSKPAQRSYDEVEAYLTSMGVGAGLATLMLATPPSGVHWMTAREEHETGIVTASVDGQTVIARAERAMAARPPEPSVSPSARP